MRQVDENAELIAFLDHLAPERRQSAMSRFFGLKITDVILNVVHELDVPDAGIVRALEAGNPIIEKAGALD